MVPLSRPRCPIDFRAGATEHDVFLSPEGEKVIKLTIPPKFGARGQVIDYVKNVLWANHLFGDDIRLVGIVATNAGPAIVTSQPFIEGGAPTQEEVAEWFLDQGYLPDGYFKWRHPESGAIIADAHPGNLVRTEWGLIPIDLQILNPGGG
ncbi:MAG: hypothetical protein KDL87_17970 [Verrucomicrobiae bacterium]|nr:hypothetical protein [Verrucomicrobiae bacterium]